MTDNNATPANDTGFCDRSVIRKINDAMDELHIANDLIDLVFMASITEQQEGISRGAGIAQEHLKTALKGLEAVTSAWREQASNDCNPKGVVA